MSLLNVNHGPIQQLAFYGPRDMMALAPDELAFFKTVYKREEDPIVAAIRKKQEQKNIAKEENCT